MREPFSAVGELIDALQSLDDIPSEDVVAALPHLLQTADLLASVPASDPEVVVAGLVHDLASALDSGCSDHARAGAALVAPLLGDRVGNLVGGHTEAKRYLVTVDASYAAHLSPNSTHTLAVQGGRMTTDELADFTGREDWHAMVDLRRADDLAKVPNRITPPVTAWRVLLDDVACRRLPS